VQVRGEEKERVGVGVRKVCMLRVLVGGQLLFPDRDVQTGLDMSNVSSHGLRNTTLTSIYPAVSFSKPYASLLPCHSVSFSHQEGSGLIPLRASVYPLDISLIPSRDASATRTQDGFCKRWIPRPLEEHSRVIVIPSYSWRELGA
jgi:hypothetical protein